MHGTDMPRTVPRIKKTKTAGGYGENSSEKGPAHSWQVGYNGTRPLTLKAINGSLTALHTYSRMGFSYPVADTNAQNMIIGLEQKTSDQLGLASTSLQIKGHVFQPPVSNNGPGGLTSDGHTMSLFFIRAMV